MNVEHQVIFEKTKAALFKLAHDGYPSTEGLENADKFNSFYSNVEVLELAASLYLEQVARIEESSSKVDLRGVNSMHRVLRYLQHASEYFECLSVESKDFIAGDAFLGYAMFEAREYLKERGYDSV
jgi:hypothetical protein